METRESITQLQQFRQALYDSFERRADALVDLIDALSSNTTARSVVELSLNPVFRRGYSSLHDAIDSFFQAKDPSQAADQRRQREQCLQRLIAQHLPPPQQRPFWLFAVDVTSGPRPYAATLADRTFVYQPQVLKGNRPVTIGHEYSVVVALPEKAAANAPNWVVPLSTRRVRSDETKARVGGEQIAALLGDSTLPFDGQLCVEVADSDYSTLPHLQQLLLHLNLVVIARASSQRVFYRRAVTGATSPNPKGGHPTWYGARFALRDAATWGCPDVTAQTTVTTRRGRTYTIHLEAWYNLLMPGSRQFPMYERPFTLIRARGVGADGREVFQHPVWLIVIGARRHELSVLDAWQAYARRFDLEHFFRFGKQRLLLDAYQTPEVEHDENWWQLVPLAYVQLWLARTLVEAIPRPWDRTTRRAEEVIVSPTLAQRDFARLIRQIGTSGTAPKRRGNSPGRAIGTRLAPRVRHPVIKKSADRPKAA